MAKVRVFRRVGGRIRSFLVDGAKRVAKIASEKATPENTLLYLPSAAHKQRVFSFKKDMRILGTLNAKFMKNNKKVAVIDYVQVNKGYRGKGISSALFEDFFKFSKKAGVKNIRSESIQSAAQVKIRAKYNSKFLLTNPGAKSKIISPEEALRILNSKGNLRGTNILATTRVK